MVKDLQLTYKCRTLQIYSRQSLSAVGESIPVLSLCDGLKSQLQLLQVWGTPSAITDILFNRYICIYNTTVTPYSCVSNTADLATSSIHSTIHNAYFKRLGLACVRPMTNGLNWHGQLRCLLPVHRKVQAAVSSIKCQLGLPSNYIELLASELNQSMAGSVLFTKHAARNAPDMLHIVTASHPQLKGSTTLATPVQQLASRQYHLVATIAQRSYVPQCNYRTFNYPPTMTQSTDCQV